ncbi:hypothetical protein, partial [Nostoc sp.]
MRRRSPPQASHDSPGASHPESPNTQLGLVQLGINPANISINKTWRQTSCSSLLLKVGKLPPCGTSSLASQ